MNRYVNQVKPEEIVLNLEDNNYATDAEVLRELKVAIQTNKTLSGYCTECDETGLLQIQLSNRIKGIIPREEVTYKLEKDGFVHLGKCQNRVGLHVPFKVKSLEEKNGEIIANLSRKDAVIEVRDRYAKELKAGDVVEGVVVGIQSYGAFIDCGGDVSGILSIRDITKVFIADPSEVLKVGQNVTVVVSSLEVDKDNNIVITYNREQLLPGWDVIDQHIKEGKTVMGRVKRIIDTGIFIELDQSYEGLAEFVPGKSFKYGDRIRVKIDLVNKEKKKIKLRIII
jgi:ribosomal protein S1